MIDKLDLNILKELQINSRASYAEVGRRVALSPSSVRERIQRLEISGVIKKYNIDVDYAQLGYVIQAFVLIKIFHGKLKSFLGVVDQYPEIRECHRILGSDNIHLKVILKDQMHLQKFIDTIMEYGHTTTHLILSEVSSMSKDIVLKIKKPA